MTLCSLLRREETSPLLLSVSSWSPAPNVLPYWLNITRKVIQALPCPRRRGFLSSVSRSASLNHLPSQSGGRSLKGAHGSGHVGAEGCGWGGSGHGGRAARETGGRERRDTMASTPQLPRGQAEMKREVYGGWGRSRGRAPSRGGSRRRGEMVLLSVREQPLWGGNSGCAP